MRAAAEAACIAKTTTTARKSRALQQLHLPIYCQSLRQSAANKASEKALRRRQNENQQRSETKQSKANKQKGKWNQNKQWKCKCECARVKCVAKSTVEKCWVLRRRNAEWPLHRTMNNCACIVFCKQTISCAVASRCAKLSVYNGMIFFHFSFDFSYCLVFMLHIAVCWTHECVCFGKLHATYNKHLNLWLTANTFFFFHLFFFYSLFELGLFPPLLSRH